MELHVVEDPSLEGHIIEIHVQEKDEKIESLIRQLQLHFNSMEGIKDKETYQILYADIFYFESVENKTFIYTEKEVFQCKQRLYELEERLKISAFVRISKSCIVNCAMIVQTRAQLNGRILVSLTNGEKLLVSKHYIQAFHNKMTGKGEG